MRFEIIGVEEATGEERTLVTDVFDEQEARDRAAAYGIRITSLRPAGDEANAAADIANDAVASGEAHPAHPPSQQPSRTGSGKGIISFVCSMIILAVYLVRMANGCNKQPERQLSPADLQMIQDRMKPKMPDWAEDAQRSTNASMEEIRKIKAAEAAKNPGAPSTGGNEEWVKDAGGQWKRVK